MFEKIVDREIPAEIVFEDKESLAFLDIHPVTLGHLLLITKKPYQWMTDVPDELLGRMFAKSKRLMEALKRALGTDYIQLSVVGKDVPHFHIHLIPRMFGDDLHAPAIGGYKESEAKEYAEKIRNAIK